MKTLTIFTPTYNRAHTLFKGYKALLNQSNKDFQWMIIDDGSIDETKKIVSDWMNNDNGFEIQYVYKENGGLHTGYNKALELIKTELCVCIDSDDYMPCDAVQTILEFWRNNKSDDIAGFIGRDSLPNGDIIGTSFPKLEKVHVIELSDKYKFSGDTKMVFRTDLLKKVAPQPTFYKEKNFNPIYLILLLDYQYSFKLLDKVLCIVEYNDEGMSRNIFRQYSDSPNSFAALRLVSINSPHISFRGKMKNYIHLGSSLIFSRNLKWFRKAPSKFLLIFSFPLSIILTLYICLKRRNH